MKKEKIGLLITGVFCLFGCVCLSVYNVVEANYTKAEIIPQWDYNEGFIPESRAESDADSADFDSVSSDSGGTVNINTASADQLAQFLPGIGPAKAKNIIDYREAVGSFVSVDELIKVDGIGEKTLQKIRPYCRVSD